MISVMLSRDPADRPAFDHILSSYRGIIFPEYFYTFLQEYMVSLAESPETTNEGNFLQKMAPSPGVRIDRVLDEWDSISIHLEGNSGVLVDPSKP
jgi:phosphoinositide-3-kinase regulatory subunit 4